MSDIPRDATPARRLLQDVLLAARLMRRELRADLRGGLKGFRVFLACLALGVAAIAAVGSLSGAIDAGVRADARLLLGGDVDLSLSHRPATAEQIAWLDANSRALSHVVQMRAMAVRPDGAARTLVELKAVDNAWPLYGTARLTDGADAAGALGQGRGGRDGDGNLLAVIDPKLGDRLELALGNIFRLGDGRFRVAGFLAHEPDKSTRAFNLGPRVLIARDALAATGLIRPGSLARYHMRVALPQGTDAELWLSRLKERFANAGWRIRDLHNAAPNISRFLDRLELFLTLTGLTALIIGGVGAGNATRAFLTTRAGTIATLKCLGAPARLIFITYLMQVKMLALIGVLIGVTVGAIAPSIAAPLLAGQLPVEPRVGFYLQPLFVAAVFGMATAILFALWPLSQARNVPAARLFRDSRAPQAMRRPGLPTMLAMVVLGAGLAALAIAGAPDRNMAFGFVVGVLLAFLVFRLVAWGLVVLARRPPRPRNLTLAMALGNLYRRGAPTVGIVTSLGIGLTVLTAMALIESNLSRQLSDSLRGESPGYFLIDIQPDQLEPFLDLAQGVEGVERIRHVPMLRGRIVALNDVPVETIEADPDFAWVLRGDRGLTWARTAEDAGGDIVAGRWWPADYDGPLQVSFDAEAARSFGLDVGDRIAINLLGREMEAEIANLRQIDWSGLGINFVMVFSPGMLSRAPQSHIATVYLPEDREAAFEAIVTDAFPNISAIRIKEVLEGVEQILANLDIAVRIIAGVVILAGALVLAGAVAADNARRVYDAVMLKVLGASRRDILRVVMLEFLLIGLVTAGIAVGLGALAARLVMVSFMQGEWEFSLPATAITLALSAAVTLVIGFAGVRGALRGKAAPLLRNE